MENKISISVVEWFLERYKSNNTLLFAEDFAEAKKVEEQIIKNEREEAYNKGYANGQMDAFTN
jgi:hypothetical protein